MAWFSDNVLLLLLLQAVRSTLVLEVPVGVAGKLIVDDKVLLGYDLMMVMV